MTPKKKLLIEYEFDFGLYGMISATKGYKLAWLINQKTGIHLIKQDDFVLEFISSEKLFVSNYLYSTEHSMIRLVKNKVFTDDPENQLFLIPELNRFDYLLMVKGSIRDFTHNQLIDELKEISDVQYISSLDINRIKSRDNLIFT